MFDVKTENYIDNTIAKLEYELRKQIKSSIRHGENLDIDNSCMSSWNDNISVGIRLSIIKNNSIKLNNNFDEITIEGASNDE